MKPSIGRTVHFNAVVDQEVKVCAALIVECEPFEDIAQPIEEKDFRVTLEVHAVRRVIDADIDLRTVSRIPQPHTYIVDHARYSPAKSGHENARNCWTWPRSEP